MPQVPLGRSFALHACSVLLSTPILGQLTALITAQTMGATTRTLSPRTSGALEVVSRGLCRSPALLVAHFCPLKKGEGLLWDGDRKGLHIRHSK